MRGSLRRATRKFGSPYTNPAGYGVLLGNIKYDEFEGFQARPAPSSRAGASHVPENRLVDADLDVRRHFHGLLPDDRSGIDARRLRGTGHGLDVRRHPSPARLSGVDDL